MTTYQVALYFSDEPDSVTKDLKIFRFDEFHEAVQFADSAFNGYHGSGVINVSVSWKKEEAPTVAADEA